MAYQLTKEQKEEIRRLTQKANRRIKTAFKVYQEAGLITVPRQLTGGIQTVEQWETKSYPLSRAVKFTSARQYRERMKMLRQFDIPEKSGGIPTMTEYQNIGLMKLRKAIRTSIGERNIMHLPDDLMAALDKRIASMTLTEQSEFWKAFSKRSQRLGLHYSSEAAMDKSMNDFFGAEEIRPLLLDAVVDASGLDGSEKKELRKQLKHYNNAALIKYLEKSRK